jgi:hypothetical protein
MSSMLCVWMPAAARSGAKRSVSQTSRHVSSNCASRGLLIQPRVRCGFRSTSRRKRPIEWEEISVTMPRAIASSARAAWVQCVMGRPASLGFSQASAMIVQICSGVNVAGVPGRGASASRSRKGRPAVAVQRQTPYPWPRRLRSSRP